MRKSPVRHTVRTYKRRNGKTVYQYPRGHGKKNIKISNPKLKQTESTSNNFNVKLLYTELPPESYPIDSSTYPEAIELALLSRSHITPPYQIEVIKL